MRIEDTMSKDLGITEDVIKSAILVARRDVKKFGIKKRNGGIRDIFHPSKKLKVIQYWLIYNVFSKIPVHAAAAAYRPGLSILDNAKNHAANRFFLKLDLKDFFPSIKYADFIGILERWHKQEAPGWELDARAKEIIRLSCFYKNDTLPIGFPSSPVISNIVMNDFDIHITKLIVSSGKYGKCVYTRYADDLVFSTNTKGACGGIFKEVSEAISSMSSPRLALNPSKTKIGSSSGGSALVTGLKVCEDGHVTIHRKQKDHVRLMLSLYCKGSLRDEDKRSLLGHLAYCRHVDPGFYSSLLRKYFKEVDRLKRDILSSTPSAETSDI
ncbi:MAG: retron St85 family RNA-directed DNA polymerase [Moraxellaceae bacterium]|nr:retron St85 family RNA-directed DNA polymerase [Moraxellaceae bacterium]